MTRCSGFVPQPFSPFWFAGTVLWAWLYALPDVPAFRWSNRGTPRAYVFYGKVKRLGKCTKNTRTTHTLYFYPEQEHTFSTIYIIFNKINKEEARFYAAFQASVIVPATPKKPEHSTRNTVEHRILSSKSVPDILPRPEQQPPSSHTWLSCQQNTPPV